MGIDITKIPEEKRREVLGEGDWVLAVPYHDNLHVTIPAAWRQQMMEMIAVEFVRWVLRGKWIEINHELDPGWDHSGRAKTHEADPMMLLIKHKTLATWLEKEYTGHSRASYVSGNGLDWYTYKDHFEEEMLGFCYNIVSEQLLAQLDEDEMDEALDSFADLDFHLFPLLLSIAGSMTVAEVWKRYQPQVVAQIEAERRNMIERQAQLRQMQWQSKAFWRRHFADLNGLRIEMREAQQVHFEQRLIEALADADPQVVEAIVEVGLPGDFSNSLESMIKMLAEQALK